MLCYYTKNGRDNLRNHSGNYRAVPSNRLLHHHRRHLQITLLVHTPLTCILLLSSIASISWHCFNPHWSSRFCFLCHLWIWELGIRVTPILPSVPIMTIIIIIMTIITMTITAKMGMTMFITRRTKRLMGSSFPRS